jgi:superfamily II DNA or RNA helicase
MSTSADTMSVLSSEELEIIAYIKRYSDQNLFKIFSKHKNIKEFSETVTEELISSRIRPYIEKQIFSVLEIARNESIPIFLKERSGQTLHFDDQLSLPTEPATPLFSFSRGEGYSNYNLTIEYSGKKVCLFSGNTEIITNIPCTVRVDKTLYNVSDIDGKKLLPFIKNRVINVPVSAEKKYYDTFVKGIINKHRVVAEGFFLKDVEQEKKVILTIEQGIKGFPVAILKFMYGKHTVFLSDEIEGFTDFSSSTGEFVFSRFKRDSTWELACAALLDEIGLNSEDGINFSVPNNSADKKVLLLTLIETITDNSEFLINKGFTIKAGSLEKPFSLSPVNLEINHSVEKDWFDLKAIVTIGEHSFPFIKLKKNILSDDREYMLPDGKWIVLPEEWFQRYKGLFEMGRDHDGSIKIHKQHFSIFKEAIGHEDNELSIKLQNLLLPSNIGELVLPKRFMATLRDYQKEGFRWLHFLRENNLGGCLADDMGLGKTLQVLALLQWNMENQSGEIQIQEQIEGQLSLFEKSSIKSTSLIVVPASLTHNWHNEIRRFCPDMRILIHQGTNRARTTSTFLLYDIVITTYHIVRTDIEFLSNYKFDTLVLDESQQIKNHSSLLYKAVIRLSGSHKIVLSGTPMENSLMDLWSQLNFVNPGLLGSSNFFKKEYVTPIENQNDIIKHIQLKKIIKPFIMRRTKEMVERELPPVTEYTILCDMSEEQSKVYESEKSVVRNTILESYNIEEARNVAIVVIQGLTKLRQIANHPLLVDTGYKYDSGKFQRIQDDIKNIISEGHKMLVFSSFVKHLDLVADWLKKQNIGYSYLTGSTTDREKVITEFNHDIAKKVFIISLKAGGVGLNLTQADYVLILDPWWNPASEQQAIGRSHRIGQNKAVFVYKYISENSIEEKINKLQSVKSSIAENFVASNNPIADMDKKSILEILD